MPKVQTCICGKGNKKFIPTIKRLRPIREVFISPEQFCRFPKFEFSSGDELQL